MMRVWRKGRAGLAPAMLAAMVLALGVSAGAVRAGDPPFCEGHPCDEDSDCGSKCTCNEHSQVCLDNTETEVN